MHGKFMISSGQYAAGFFQRLPLGPTGKAATFCAGPAGEKNIWIAKFRGGWRHGQSWPVEFKRFL